MMSARLWTQDMLRVAAICGDREGGAEADGKGEWGRDGGQRNDRRVTRIEGGQDGSRQGKRCFTSYVGERQPCLCHRRPWTRMGLQCIVEDRRHRNGAEYTDLRTGSLARPHLADQGIER